MENKIYQQALLCKEFADKRIESRRVINTAMGTERTTVRGDINGYESLLNSLKETIKDKYPLIEIQLSEVMDKYDSYPYRYQGILESIVEIIISLELQTKISDSKAKEGAHESRKFFISHSSKDKEIVEKFVDHILLLGVGLSPEDIFCTSIEDLAIKNGEDIRKHIHSNIRGADFSIIIISNNYKKSEICLNEMGAVWAFNNNVRYYLLPDSDFDTIGWLCNPSQAEKLFNSITLDKLKMELSRFYSLEDKGTTWSRQRETFLKHMSALPNTDVIESSKETTDITNDFSPLLDCNVYETKVLTFLETNPDATYLDISKYLGLSVAATKKTILSLINKGFLEREGSIRNIRWIVKV